MSRAKVLVTGFGPFAQDSLNPSELVARALDGRIIADAEVKSVILPVDAGRVGRLLEGAITALSPALVISLGYAAGRTCINLERVALNVMDFTIPDTAGNRPNGVKIVPDAPDAYFSTLPLAAIEGSLRADGVPCTVSTSAGTYLCNQVMYLSLHSRWVRSAGCRAGFVHIPALPTMDKALTGRVPSMSLELMIRGIELAISCALTH